MTLFDHVHTDVEQVERIALNNHGGRSENQLDEFQCETDRTCEKDFGQHIELTEPRRPLYAITGHKCKLTFR